MYSKYFLLRYLTTKRAVRIDVRRLIPGDASAFSHGRPRTLYSLILYIHNTGMFLSNAPRVVSSKHRNAALSPAKKKSRDHSISRERASPFRYVYWNLKNTLKYLISWLKSSTPFILSSRVFTP